MSIYPDDWPRCPVCGDFALHGHITCGSYECDEHGTRRKRDGDIPFPEADRSNSILKEDITVIRLWR